MAGSIEVAIVPVIAQLRRVAVGTILIRIDVLRLKASGNSVIGLAAGKTHLVSIGRSQAHKVPVARSVVERATVTQDVDKSAVAAVEVVPRVVGSRGI